MNLPSIVGILNIIEGVMYGIGPMLLLIWGELQARRSAITIDRYDLHVLIPFALVCLPVALLNFIGGIQALKRRRWGWTFASSIAVFFPSTMILLITLSVFISDFKYNGIIDFELLIFFTPFILAIVGFCLTLISKSLIKRESI